MQLNSMNVRQHVSNSHDRLEMIITKCKYAIQTKKLCIQSLYFTTSYYICQHTSYDGVKHNDFITKNIQ